MTMDNTMGRRAALAGIGTGLLCAFLDRGRAVSPSRRILLNEFWVAGFQYHDGMAVRDQIRAGDALVLVREPENPYDRCAIALHWQGRHIGYVPRVENPHLSQMLCGGLQVAAEVVRACPNAEPWDMICARVSLLLT